MYSKDINVGWLIITSSLVFPKIICKRQFWGLSSFPSNTQVKILTVHKIMSNSVSSKKRYAVFSFDNYLQFYTAQPDFLWM